MLSGVYAGVIFPTKMWQVWRAWNACNDGVPDSWERLELAAGCSGVPFYRNLAWSNQI